MGLPKRKSVRLKNYDYSQIGYYFVTICTKDRKNLFWNMTSTIPHLQEIILSQTGQIVDHEILNIEHHYTNIKIDKYTIMPNHVHMIIAVTEQINPFSSMKYDISNVVGKFKASVTRNVGNAFMHSEKISVWQHSFHDHIIRGEQDYLKIWQYIDSNPSKWEEDCFYIP